MSTELYFKAGVKLWKLDSAGVLSQVGQNFTLYSAEGVGLTSFNGELYFSASGGSSGVELWKVKADGSVVQVSDINPGAGSSNPTNFRVFNGELYFNVNTGTLGAAGVYKVQADGSVVEVLAPSNLLPLINGPLFNGELYLGFGGASRELWKIGSDGSIVLISEINPEIGQRPGSFSILNDELYFTARNRDNSLVDEIWKVKANGTFVRVADFNASELSPDFNGQIYFSVSERDPNFHLLITLWTVTADGSLVQIPDISLSSAASGFTIFNDELYFSANIGTSGVELWKVRADGSVVQVADINPGTASSGPSGFTVFNGELYFAADTSTSGVELWKVRADGSVVQVADINPGPAWSLPYGFTIFKDELYFGADTSTSGTELWKVKADGSVAQAADIIPGQESSFPNLFTLFTTAVAAPTNQAPVVTAPVASSAPEDDPAYTVNLLQFASDPDNDVLHVTNLTGLANGVTLDGDMLRVNPTAYNSLAVGEHATITVNYNVVDGNGGSVPQTATITINGENDAPVALPDFATAQKNGAPVSGNVLANDYDPDTHDAPLLHVSTVNGDSAKVGMSFDSRYGALTLNARGNYTYVSNLSEHSVSVLQHQGYLVDHFSYTVDDTHHGTNISALDIVTYSGKTLQEQAALSGGDILNDAIGHLTGPNNPEVWGNFNCTGFVYTVSCQTNIADGFFDPTHTQAAWVGPRGTDNRGPLLNSQNTHDANDPDFLVPISDIRAFGADSEPTSNAVWLSSTQFVFVRPDKPGDGWHLVGNTAGNNTSLVDAADPTSFPQPGDLFRGVVDGKDGHALIVHSGVVSAYDPATSTIWLISNWEEATVRGNAPITYDAFYLGQSGSSRDIVGPYTIYRLDSAPTNINDMLRGGPGSDHLGGGMGNDTIVGGPGSDQLWGGSGNDHFVFSLKSNGLDQIMDFSAGDSVDFSRIGFGNHLALGGANTGTLDPSHFVANATGPTNAAQEFWYNTANQTLYFDPDGSGHTTPIAMAHLANGYVLHNVDIHLI